MLTKEHTSCDLTKVTSYSISHSDHIWHEYRVDTAHAGHLTTTATTIHDGCLFAKYPLLLLLFPALHHTEYILLTFQSLTKK